MKTVTELAMKTVLLLPLLAFLVLGRGTAVAGLTVNSVGSGSTLEMEDSDAASQRALDAALENAVMKVAGIYVCPDVFECEKERINGVFSDNWKYYISDYEKLSDDRDGKGVYTVNVRVTVKEKKVEAALVGNLDSRRTVVLVQEKNNDTALAHAKLESLLIRQFNKKGYFVSDTRMATGKSIRKQMMLARLGRLDAIKSVALYFMADNVVAASASSRPGEKVREDYYSARAIGELCVHKVSKGSVLCSIQKESKGFGISMDRAGADALNYLEQEISDTVSRELKPRPLHAIKIFIREIPGHDSYERAKRVLSSIPGVREVKGTYGKEKAVFSIKAEEGISLIAEKISSLKEFVVEGLKEGAIWLEARKLS